MTDDQKPNQIVGRTFADLVIHTETGPKLDKALSRLADWSIERVELGAERIRKVFLRTDRVLEENNVDPKAIPERVGIEVMENVAREEREELYDLWARLLAGAAGGKDVDAYHIDVIRKLDRDSALVFIAIGDKLDGLPLTTEQYKSVHTEAIDALGKLCRMEPVKTHYALARLVALGLITLEQVSTVGSSPFRLTGFAGQVLNILYPEGPKRDGSHLREFFSDAPSEDPS